VKQFLSFYLSDLWLQDKKQENIKHQVVAFLNEFFINC